MVGVVSRVCGWGMGVWGVVWCGVRTGVGLSLPLSLSLRRCVDEDPGLAELTSCLRHARDLHARKACLGEERVPHNRLACVLRLRRPAAEVDAPAGVHGCRLWVPVLLLRVHCFPALQVIVGASPRAVRKIFVSQRLVVRVTHLRGCLCQHRLQGTTQHNTMA